MIDPLAHPARDANGAALTLAWRRVIGPGFALPRDAGRRPALQAVPALFLGWGTRFRRPLGGDAGVNAPTGRTGRRSLSGAALRTWRSPPQLWSRTRSSRVLRMFSKLSWEMT